MTPVDPVVRAKLADTLRESQDRYEISTDWDAAADSLLGLPPSVRAQLLGLPSEESYAVQWDPSDLDGPFSTEEEARAYAERTRIDDADTFAVVSSTSYRLTTPWAPVGVAGRNQPNPKEGEADAPL